MPNDRYLDEFPDAEERARGSAQAPSGGEPNKESWLSLIWERLSHAGLGETVYRVGTAFLTVALILLAVVGMRWFYLRFQQSEVSQPKEAALAAVASTPTPTAIPASMPVFSLDKTAKTQGIYRLAMLHTTIPSRPRTEIITYTVKTDDTIFGIAEMFGLKPETILWGNYYTLTDDPHNLRPGVVLNILPLDGVYHRWSEGEGLNGVSHGLGVTPEVIINWAGNHLDPVTLGDYAHPNIEPGTMLLVPGGHRDFVTWSAPRISRSNPGVARVLGPGSCGTVVDGAVGTGSFIWPASLHRVSGYEYSPSTNHFGIDIAGTLGDPIYAADNGVIVYAGWNDWGYGNVVVIDHDGGWQTLYAHLSSFNVGCGQSVYQGDLIGAFGSTGNSSGPHLHFEMLNESYGKVNPWNFLP
jgi:hypothetical protein